MNLRMWSGIFIISILAGLCGLIALGQVEEKTSYGLMPLIVALSNVAVIWANWAFNTDEDRKQN